MTINVTNENRYKGTLQIEAFHSLIESIEKDAENETERVVDITFNAIGAAASTVHFAVDPLGSLFGMGFGWLIEHVSFLREPLDQLMGDPDVVQANVEATKARATEIRSLAEDHHRGLATFDGWTGESADRYRTSMELMTKEIDALAKAINTKAKVVAVSGVLVTVMRDIVRDMIAMFLGSLTAGAAISGVASFFTAGAAAAAFTAYAVGRATALAADIGAKIAKLIAALARMVGRTAKLDDAMKNLGQSWKRFENLSDVGEVGWESYKAAKDVDKR